MARAKVALADNIKRTIWVDDAATEGAQLGTNLYGPDGKVLTVQGLRDLLEADDTPDPNNGLYPTVWSLILDIPPNIVALAALTGEGYPYRKADGSWQLRRSGRAVIPFAFGDASPVEVYVTQEASTLALVRVVIDQAFNGAGAALRVGTPADDDLYLDDTDISPDMLASFEAKPDAAIPAGSVVSLTIVPGSGATAGAGRIIVDTIPTAES